MIVQIRTRGGGTFRSPLKKGFILSQGTILGGIVRGEGKLETQTWFAWNPGLPKALDFAVTQEVGDPCILSEEGFEAEILTIRQDGTPVSPGSLLLNVRIRRRSVLEKVLRRLLLRACRPH